MGKPTFGQTAHYYCLVADGKITAENFQAFLENPDKFFEENSFPATVDYKMTLVDMIAVGKYDWKSRDIMSEHFPITGERKANIKLRLIHFGREITTEYAVPEIEALGFQLAKIEHLLAFGAKYPNKQREFPIVALGSGWVRSDGRRIVPCLRGGGSERDLHLRWDHPSGAWSAYDRFLVVSK